MSTSDTIQSQDDTPLLDIQPEGARRAARRVYDLLHLRTAIIRLLAKHELATMLRVDKRGMEMVARELYHTMRYNEALKISSVDPTRLEMYDSSVVVINARSGEEIYSMDVSLSDREVFGFEEQESDGEEDDSNWDLLCWLRRYHPEMVDVLVPPLRERFPFLRRIEFGDESVPFYSSQTWTVHLPPRNTRRSTPALPPSSPHDHPPTPSSAPSTPVVGHIQHSENILLDLHEAPPPSTLIQLPRPTENYSILQLFDITVYSGSTETLESTRHDEWLNALRTAPWLGNLYKGFDSGPIRINTADLINLYAHQEQSGLDARLMAIEAENIIPPSISDFHHFATVASTSLTELVLCDCADVILAEDKVKIAFGDLPSLFSIIRNDLPNLTRFAIAVKGVAAGEAVCRSLLTEDGLERRGSLHSLRLLTGGHTSYPFNALRFAATKLSEENFNIRIGCMPVGEEVQTAFVKHLRSQSSSRRRHLSTVDFPSLEVTTPAHVRELQYLEGGKPRRRGEKIAQDLFGEVRDRERDMTHGQLPTLAAKLTMLTAAAARLQAVSTDSATTTEMLKAGREMMGMVESVVETGNRVQEMIQETQSLGLDLEEYLGLLESIEGDI